MTNPYGPLLIEHFRHPHNRRVLPSPSLSQEGTNPLCGDRVRIEVRVDGGLVQEAGFTANACALCVAAASMLTDLVHAAPVDEVETLTVDDLLRALDAEVPAARLNCIRLPLTVLHTGLMLFRQQRGVATVARHAPVAAVLLAAGQARRFGAQKLLAPFGSSTVIRTVADTLGACTVDHVVVVVGPNGDAIRAALSGLPLGWVDNPAAERGMSTSLSVGIGTLPPNVGAAIVVLGDQPTLSVNVVNRLVEAWRTGSGPIVAPRYRGLRGNPVLFDRVLFSDLRLIDGDRGARDLIAADPSRVTLVDIAEPPPLDVDTPADYDELLRRRVRRA